MSDRMIDPVQLPDGTVIDLRTVTAMSDQDKLLFIQAIVDRKFADDADKYERDAQYSLEKIDTVLGFTSPEGP